MIRDVMISLSLLVFLPCLFRGNTAKACGERCPNSQDDEGESQGALRGKS